MSNTYTKIYLHIIFAVKGRESLLPIGTQMRVHQYMAKMLRENGHYPVAIGGIDNHVHLLIDYKPTQSLPEMIRELKTATTKLINTNHLIPFQFAWQRGYSCFSYSASHVERVKRYVERQIEHHKNMTLREEIMKAYDYFGIDFDQRYIFEE